MKRPDIEAIRQSPRQWCDVPTVERLSDYAMLLEDENAALKEQVAAESISTEQHNRLIEVLRTRHEADLACVRKQHKENADIINDALRVQVAQQAEAIRVKDAALSLPCDRWNATQHMLVQNAIAIKPSPDTLNERDEKVAEACARLIDESEVEETHHCMNTFEEGTRFQRNMVAAIGAGEWRKYL